MARRAVKLLFGAVVAAVVLVTGSAFALVGTTPGNGAIRRLAVLALRRAVDGRVTIGSVGGNLWRAADLRDVTLESRDGRPVIHAQRVRATFALGDLLRARFRFASVLVVRPVVVLEQGVDGRWNIERLFRLTAPRAGPPGRRPLVELRDARVLDGTLVVREHRLRDSLIERAVYGLAADLPRLRLSHPDSTAIEASFRSLAARVANPDLKVTGAEGTAALDGDSLRFAFSRVSLPATSARASGLVRWGGAHTAFDVAVNATRFAFQDVRALVPLTLPAEGGGSVALHLRLLSDASSEFDVGSATIRSGRTAVSGTGRLALGARSGVSVRGMTLVLSPLDLAFLRPYAGSLPAHGLVRGRLRGSGALRAGVVVDGALAWADASVEGAPVNTVTGHGRLVLGGRDGLGFDGFTVERSDIDLRTVRRFAPSLDLDGRLRAAGSLDGPWRDASFRGTLEQRGSGEGGLASIARGRVHLGLRDTLRIDADVDVDPLSLDLLRRTFQWIPFDGALGGHATVHGPLGALAVDAALRGAMGSFTVKGTLGAGESAVTLALTGGFDTLDVHRLSATAPPSALNGRWETELAVPSDTARPLMGTVRVALGPGVFSGVAVSGGGATLRLEPVRAAVDSGRLEFEGGVARATGGIGRGGGLPGRLEFSVRADTVAYLEPLVRWLRRSAGDSSDVKLDGAAFASGQFVGTTGAWQLDVSAGVAGAQLGADVGRGVRATARVAYDPRGYRVMATAAADTIGAAGLSYGPVGLGVSGTPDSLAIRATAGFHSASAVRVALTVSSDSVERRIRVDSLDLDLPVRSWHLVHPARLVVTDSAVRVDALELRPRSGSGLVRASGALPRAGEGSFELAADSVPVADVYGLAQRDTAGINGAMNGNLRIAGRADAPVISLHAALTEGRFGDYRLPLVQVVARYQEQRLALEGGLWRDTLRLVAVTGSVPIDLSLRAVARRQLPGALDIVARADSLDMTVLDPLTDLVTGLSGGMTLDVRIGGTWDAPTLAGLVDVRDGVLRIPALGARYTGLDARLVLDHDLMRVTRGVIQSPGGGRLDVTGQVRFESLTRPVLDLTLNAAQFAAFDIRDFGGLTATGSLALRGPAIGAILSGRIDVDAGYLQFRDLVEKRIVSLDDPEFRALVDSNLARAAGLGPAVHTVFIDSLRISGLAVAMGPDVWLRSSEANIQLAGDFDVQRSFEDGISRYRLDGTLRAVRGTYRLTLGKENSFLAIARDFRVTRGTVRFFGTPDFNPGLDIAAEHVVRTAQGSQLTMRALIGGTLLYPQLRLESDARVPLTETEIVSYLMFGQPPSALGQGASARGEAALAQAVGSSIVGGVGQALVSELGLPLDYLTIVPGAARTGSSLGVSPARVEAGAQLGERTFLTLNAGLCEVLTAQLVGATLEYRLTGRWTASAAFEPVIPECGTSAGLSALSTRYQFGFDLFWQQGIR